MLRQVLEGSVRRSARWLSDRALAAAQRLCAVAGHTGGLDIARGSVKAVCDSCGHASPGLEVHPAPPLVRPPAAVTPMLAWQPSLLTVVLTPTGAELHITNTYRPDGSLGVSRHPLGPDQLIEMAVSSFLAAVDVTGVGHTRIGARCLASRTGLPLELAHAIAADAVERVVLCNTRPVTRGA